MNKSLALALIIIMTISVVALPVKPLSAQSASSPRLIWEHGLPSFYYFYPYEHYPHPEVMNYHFESPAVAIGIVYVGVDSGADGGIYAFNATDGLKLWNYSLGSGAYFISKPTVTNGIVYISCSSDGTYALNTNNGTVLWNFVPPEIKDNGGTMGFGIITAPAITNGVVYIGAADGNLYALNAINGQKIWNFSAKPVSDGNGIFSSATVSEGKIYFGSNNHYFYCLNSSSGTEIWDFPTGGQIHSTPTTSNGIIYLASDDGNLYALDASKGSQVWKVYLGGFTQSKIEVSNGVVYLNTENHSLSNSSIFDRLYAVNANNGNELWNFLLGNASFASENSWSSPAVSGGVVYVGSLDNNIYAINALSGSLIWNYTNKIQVDSSPELSNGALYIAGAIGEDNASLCAFNNLPNVSSTMISKLSNTELIGIVAALVASVVALIALVCKRRAHRQKNVRQSQF